MICIATLQLCKFQSIFIYLQAIASNDNSSRIDKNRLFSTTTCLEKPVFCSTADEAVKDIPSGSKLLVGGKEVKHILCHWLECVVYPFFKPCEA